MFKCTGVCHKCGMCRNTGVDDSKIKMLTYTEGFRADRGTGLGVAFDMGTTTVAGMLWDFALGQQLAAAAMPNPQRDFGRDVISRIAYCGKDEEKLQTLRSLIAGCMNSLIAELCRKSDRRAGEITRAAVCGNTSMSHIFAGYSPAGLAFAPFTPAYTGTLKTAPEEVLLDLPGCRQVTVLPNIAGHVGGDITAGLLASGIPDMEGLNLFIDIGTNGEILLADGKEMLTCSTAAGPAFEGSEVKCGSNIINIIADMLDAGQIDRTGRLLTEETLITQQDIRDIQLAKGAISAGIEILLEKVERKSPELDRIIIAGAFGNNIKKESAIRIGLIPEVAPEKIISAGNAAGAGVSMALVNANMMKKAESIPEMVKHVELAEEAEFQKTFFRAMNF